MSGEFFLMIVIPELILFSIWVFLCISSIEQPKTNKKKKSKIIELYKTNYPFEEGSPIIYDSYLRVEVNND